MDRISSTINKHLNMLCNEIGSRTIGSLGNKKAVIYVKEVLKNLELEWKSSHIAVRDGNVEKLSFYLMEKKLMPL